MGRGCDGTANTGVTQKLDNNLKVIRNPIHRNLDNPLRGIRNLVPNRILIQWSIGLTLTTLIEIKESNQQLIATFQWYQYNLQLPLQHCHHQVLASPLLKGCFHSNELAK